MVGAWGHGGEGGGGPTQVQHDALAVSRASTRLLLLCWPAGSLAALCLEEQGLSGSTLGSTAGDQNDTCSTWASFCLSDVGSGFWGLCGGKRNGTAQAPAAAAVPSPSPVAASPPPVQLLQPPSERASAQGQLVPGSSLTGELEQRLLPDVP